ISAVLGVAALLAAPGQAIAGLSTGLTRAQATQVASIPKQRADEVTAATKTAAVPAEAKDEVRAGTPVETPRPVRSRPQTLRHRDSGAVQPRTIRRDTVRTVFATFRPFRFAPHCHGWR